MNTVCLYIQQMYLLYIIQVFYFVLNRITTTLQYFSDSQQSFRAIENAGKLKQQNNIFQRILLQVMSSEKQSVLHWIPSHFINSYNEELDKRAKETINIGEVITQFSIPIDHYRRFRRKPLLKFTIDTFNSAYSQGSMTQKNTDRMFSYTIVY